MRPIRTLLGAFMAVWLLAGAGCGLSTNDSPETLARDNLPSDLGGAPRTEPSIPETEGVSAQFWFMDTTVEPAMLAGRESTVPRNPTPQIILERLFTFPQDDLAESRMRSAIPTDTRTVRDPTIEDGVLVLDLPETFYSGIAEDEGRYAYGQIVLTIAENFGSRIDAVQFTLDGQETPVSDGSGAERANGVVSGEDFDTLRVPSAVRS